MLTYEQRLENFFSNYTHQTFQRGDTLIWDGQEPEGVYYLKEGHVRQYAISEHTGNCLTLHIYNPGSFFPMIWAMAEKRNRYFFDAMGPVTVYRAPKEAVLAFLQQDPELLYAFSQRLLSGLNGLLLRLETYAFTDVYGRLISQLLYLAKHFGEPSGTGVILPHFTHQELANFIGAARETTTIAVDKLIKNGLVMHQEHRIYLPSLEQLIHELNKKRPR